MVKVEVGTDGREIYLDGFLKTNLDAMKKVIKKDWDMVVLVDGYEGTGKSVIAQQCAAYVDPSFDADRICFKPEEFVKAINDCQKYGAVVFDEAMTGLSSRASMSGINRMLVQVLAEIRQKNLFVFIVMPCFFEMDKYAAVWRSRALIHVYTGQGMQRGFFTFYNQDKKKDLYILGKKFYSYRKVKANFRGSFTKGYAVDEKIYRQKKKAALGDYSKKADTDQASQVDLFGDKLLYFLRQDYTTKEIEDKVGMSPRQINHRVLRYKNYVLNLGGAKVSEADRLSITSNSEKSEKSGQESA